MAQPSLARIPSSSPHDGQALVALSAAFGEKLAAGAAARDSERRLPFAEIRELAASGLLAARVPAEYGGPEVSMVDYARIILNLAKGDPNVAQAAAPVFPNVEKVRIYGSETQKRRYFDLVLDGRLFTGNAAAERGGKRIGDMTTRVTRNAGGYRLNGRKYYATGTLFAEYVLVTSHLGDDSRAAVIVPTDREGVTVTDDWDGMGQRTTASGTAVFDNVRLDPDEIMPIPAYGQRRTYEGAYAQLMHAALDAGIALAALEDGIRYGRDGARPLPEAGVERAADDPYVLHTIGEMAIQTHAAVALVERGAALLDRAVEVFFSGKDADRLLGEASIAVAEAKFLSSEASIKVSEMIFRIGGASATSRQRNLDRHWRNARTHTTHDPVAYKARAVGDFYLNDALPPINTKI
ncbi:acyl-CoA dehydrogenase family protein [Chelatococcus sp. YT9]|uniref:acyl-CoA dehydrogenase family protein n=1 Tax=Chelatococcus sp. YT9 TaxID=2835635 RepID=UPI001BCC4F39|nr:acyl-CoA dehydrogenase family protein [Chelatococcus sp. YT9]MBS7699055.1 acyl-CoA dehydrogenase family protein [Chelatococcus sp. YT9]